jgi:hypothetical protein
MSRKSSLVVKTARLSAALALAFILLVPSVSQATSQWARKTGLSCSACHTVFPRLNSFGEEYLQNGYQLKKEHDEVREENEEAFLEKVEHLLGFRLNVTPVMLETNIFRKDSSSEKQARWTIGNPNWIQFFVAGSIVKDISFFSELEFAGSGFKFNWFYFNFTNLLGTKLLNLQLGNISPLEFASYPNRLPQLPALKGEAMLLMPSNGKGEESAGMSTARPGVQYYGRNEWGLLYGGVSPGTKATNANQFIDYWGGLVLSLPEDIVDGFEGSNATIHYYNGTDTKGTGNGLQVMNEYSRISPQINIRYNDQVDIQGAFIMGIDKNRDLSSSSAGDFKYNGFAIDAGYMPIENWHLAMHYDKYTSDDNLPNGKPVLDYQRIVPAVTYIINENIRGTIYYEHDLTDKPSSDKVAKVYLNLRSMF